MKRRIALFSDLHVDTGNYDPDPFEADLAVVAGDVVEVAGGSPIAWIKAHIPTHIPTIFVPGNHDFYGGRLGNLLNIWRAQALRSHVTVLYNEVFDWDGIDILGTPLWSGLDLRRDVIEEAFLRRTLPMRIADFSCIFQSDGKGWTVGQMLKESEKARAFLQQELTLRRERKKVVVTHWPPAKESISPDFIGDELNPYFVNDLPELVQLANLWLHGHVHDSFDYRLGDDPERGRVACHPRGYPGERNGRAPYQPKIIEIA